MRTLYCAVLLDLLFIGALPDSSRALAGVVADGPQNFSPAASIGAALRKAAQGQKQRPVHIIYVHGMGYVPRKGSTGPGESEQFQQGICALLPGCQLPSGPARRDYADTGEFASGAGVPVFKYLGNPVWTGPEQWSASAPFVDHYVLRLSDGRSIVVDEINWWPLVFPLKCRVILAGGAHLAGPDANLLDLCSQEKRPDKPSHPGRFLTYPFIDRTEADMLKKLPPRGALLNRVLKSSILDWGFSDAIMTVGSLHDLFSEGMRQLFVKSSRFHADGSTTDEWEGQATSRSFDREFIAVSHSLGSYLVFSTLNTGPGAGSDNAPIILTQPRTEAEREDLAAQYILARTSVVYFFANQVSLLELANTEETKAVDQSTANAVKPGSSGNLLPTNSLARPITTWSHLRKDLMQKLPAAEKSGMELPQFIAWSDPSDVLSWYVPPIADVSVVNLYVRNSRWHWLFADPTAAHDGYAGNKHVLRTMLGREIPKENAPH